ncbi:3'-5' exonuclease [Robiginitalea aurantiaca]|uniref:3'-5' exonuclease n=1 Tax=Robiginitalea aurantiaca TaxID=3056915 RepID=A0ABT7WH77_9FLAO|nr:3'-5' exonuclease [Robiginitalea aurantiaca]MDM9632213.1 3'-5' exonuclease [Robiginitalea aurantiaca]
MILGKSFDLRRVFAGSGRVSDTPVTDVSFAVIDSETTGLDPLQDRILSLGGLKIKDNRIKVSETLELFLAQDHFDARSVPIHGIMREGPNKRISEKEALVQLRDYVGDAILVGHHIGFDLEMIRRAQQRHQLPYFTNIALDTGLLYRKTLLKSPLVPKKQHYSLDELAEKYNISCKDRHTALGDAYITALAFLQILSQLQEKRDLTLKALIRMGT